MGQLAGPLQIGPLGGKLSMTFSVLGFLCTRSRCTVPPNAIVFGPLVPCNHDGPGRSGLLGR
jgi:hypothetical protein